MLEMPSYISSYIINLNSGEAIPLVTAPNSLSEGISNSLNEQDILARSAPIITYTGTGSRQVSMTLKVHEDILPRGYDINSYVNAMKALAYPMYNNNIVSPPNVKLFVGSSLNIIGMCSSVNVTWETTTFRDNKIIIASIEVSIKETRTSCPGTTTIRNGG